MNQDGHNLVMAVVSPSDLAGACRPQYYWVDNFQMRRIKRHRHMHFAARGLNIGCEAKVVFNITRAFRAAVAMYSFKFIEQHGWRFTHNVNQHIQPATVRHAHHHFFHAVGAGVNNDFVEQGNQAVTTLK